MKTDLDLATCAREPIHIPGAIQPHGVLLLLSDDDALSVVATSDNTDAHLARDPKWLVGKRVEEVLTSDSAVALRKALARKDPRVASPLALAVAERGFDGIVHRTGGFVALELEPAPPAAAGVSFHSFYHHVRGSVLALQASATQGEVMQAACDEVRRITGFGRVMLYRFDPEWNGDVVGESLAPGMSSYLGLRFPHSDIPEQARKLYERNWLRLIVDVSYRPSVIVPEARDARGAPLDLSASVLRSVSPVHLEYLRNMGVKSSMSISIMKDGRLWGLIACHDVEPRPVAFQVRNACEFLGQMLSYQLAAIEGREDYLLREDFKERRLRFMRGELELHEVLRAAGAIRFVRGEVATFGVTPPAPAVDGLIAWLQKQVSAEEVYATYSLAQVFLPARELQESASGVLALSLGEDAEEGLVVWLRPELPRTVEWAGDPSAPVVQEGARLHPRRSFDLWKETVRLRSVPWLKAEVDVARDLRAHLISVELATANARLKRSNEELDAFTAIASHDLKEPLRGIRNYLSFVLEDDGEKVSSGSQQKLQSVISMARRMDDLLSALYHYSRLGRVELGMVDTDLNDVLGEVLARLRGVLDERRVQVRVPRRLPTLRCDFVRVGEVFYNLVANAAKYTDAAEPLVEVGWEEGPVPVVYVKDNGIGIEPRHFETIFRVFRRLHSTTKFGGGTGTGLTIVKRIVERHEGRIWVESETAGPQRGTTVRFTLGSEPS